MKVPGTSEVFFRSLVDNLNEGLYFVDANRVITYWNNAAERITGFTASEVLGKQCSDNILTHIDADGNSLCLGMCPLAHTVEDGILREAEVYLHHKDGQRIPVAVRTAVITDDSSEVVGGVELFTDISNRSVQEFRIKELEKLALLDTLTQIPNRNYLNRQMEMRFEEFNRQNLVFGVLFMDIDFFKKFNDTYGHETGDRVLKFVANTLKSNSRAFDLYGRWGGEEFLGIIPNVDSVTLFEIANRMRMLLANSYLMQEDTKLSVTISVGATIVNESDTIDSIVARADKLLYQSKEEGRNRVTCHG